MEKIIQDTLDSRFDGNQLQINLFSLEDNRYDLYTSARIDSFHKLLRKLPSNTSFQSVYFFYKNTDEFSNKCLNELCSYLSLMKNKIKTFEVEVAGEVPNDFNIITTHLNLDVLNLPDISEIRIRIPQGLQHMNLAIDQKADSLIFKSLSIVNGKERTNVILDTKIFNNKYQSLYLENIQPLTFNQFESIVKRCREIFCNVSDTLKKEKFMIDLNYNKTQKIEVSFENISVGRIEVRGLNVVDCKILLSKGCSVPQLKYILGADSMGTINFNVNSVYDQDPIKSATRKIEIEYSQNVKYVNELSLPDNAVTHINRKISYGKFAYIGERYVPFGNINSIENIEIYNNADFDILKNAIYKKQVPKETIINIYLESSNGYEQISIKNRRKDTIPFTLDYIFSFLELTKKNRTVINYPSIYYVNIPADTNSIYQNEYYKNIKTNWYVLDYNFDYTNSQPYKTYIYSLEDKNLIEKIVLQYPNVKINKKLKY